MKKMLFCINFKFFSIGGGMKNLEKSIYGKLVFIDNFWAYILADTKIDFDSLMANLHGSTPFWRSGSIVVETENIENCLNIFLSYIRCGYLYKEDDINVMYYDKVIDEKIDGRKPIFDITFNDWPIRINEIEVFQNCKSINKKWRKKGVLVCCNPVVEGCISAVDMCPIGCFNSGLDDGECLPSAYISTNRTKNIIKKTNLFGQEFDLIEITWDRK